VIDSELDCLFYYGSSLAITGITALSTSGDKLTATAGSDWATQRQPPCIPDDTTDDTAAGVTREATPCTCEDDNDGLNHNDNVRAGASQAYAPPVTSQRQRRVGSNRATQRHPCIPDDDDDDAWGEVPLPMCATGP
jgi:hypothetical protein